MNTNKLTILLSVLVAAVSCNKTELLIPSPESTGKVDLCIKGEFNDFSTKASIENVFRMTWAEGKGDPIVYDSVYVYGKANGEDEFSCLGKLGAVPDASTGNRVADLKGKITAPKADTKLTLVYSPILTSAPSVSNAAISIDLSSQSGTANDVTFVAYTTVDYKNDASAAYRTSFSFATSVLRVNVSDLSASTALTQATLGDVETNCKLTFASDAAPAVAGDISTGTITRNFTDCSANAKGSAAFYLAVPAISENENRTLMVTQTNSYRTEYRGFATGEKGAGNMMNSIARMEYAIFDLSFYGTANCYLVPGAGNYKFKATVKGNSQESVGTPATAAVLWESFGTSTVPNVADLVRNVTLTDGYVNFTATDKKGNALIAVKDDSGNILWSWHIWMTDAPALQVYNNNAGIMMDRNLGATSATPGDVRALGLIYQWGRKDPFMSGNSIAFKTSSFQKRAASTILIWPTANASEHLSGNNTLDYSVKNPTTFILNTSSPYDWYCTSGIFRNDTLWRSTKTIYDPCPAGYRVPDGGDNGVWAIALTSSPEAPESNWDDTNRGMDFGATDMRLGTGTIWYPGAGVIRRDDASLESVGAVGNYWSCNYKFEIYTSGTNCSAYNFNLGNSGGYNPTSYYTRAWGLSVRCLAE